MRDPVDKWPAPPQVLSEVVRLTSEPDPNLREIAAAISADATLTTQLLSSVSSGYYSTRAPITTVERAVSFLGGSALRSLVMCLVLPRVVGVQQVGDFALEPYWESSLRRAVSGRYLAERIGLSAPSQSFTVGLVQDFGVLLQLANDPTQGSFFEAMSGLSSTDRLAEERMTGISHDEVGAQLLLTWQLPEELVAPVRFHHDPELAPHAMQTRSNVACVAEYIADLWSATDKCEALDMAETNLERVGLQPRELGPLVDAINEEVSETAGRLGIKVFSGLSYDDLSAAADAGVAYSHQV